MSGTFPKGTAANGEERSCTLTFTATTGGFTPHPIETVVVTAVKSERAIAEEAAAQAEEAAAQAEEAAAKSEAEAAQAKADTAVAVAKAAAVQAQADVAAKQAGVDAKQAKLAAKEKAEAITAWSASGAVPSTSFANGAGSITTCGSRTESISATTKSTHSAHTGQVSPTAHRRTPGWPPGCAALSTCEQRTYR